MGIGVVGVTLWRATFSGDIRGERRPQAEKRQRRSFVDRGRIPGVSLAIWQPETEQGLEHVAYTRFANLYSQFAIHDLWLCNAGLGNCQSRANLGLQSLAPIQVAIIYGQTFQHCGSSHCSMCRMCEDESWITENNRKTRQEWQEEGLWQKRNKMAVGKRGKNTRKSLAQPAQNTRKVQWTKLWCISKKYVLEHLVYSVWYHHKLRAIKYLISQKP